MRNKLYEISCTCCDFTKRYQDEQTARDDLKSHEQLVDGEHNTDIKEKTICVDNIGYMWIPVLVRGLFVPACALVVLLPSIQSYNQIFDTILAFLFVFLASIWFICWIISPVAIYFDKRRIYRYTGWMPEWTYYLVILGVIGDLLAGIYLYKRYTRVGFDIPFYGKI
ncbi:hypothetical protein [Haloplanus salilacus]|uniref:hypothetical protein n=1 Tax=Haloplanus salilacus TaxID=2949994 RepID=UPI0030D47DD2